MTATVNHRVIFFILSILFIAGITTAIITDTYFIAALPFAFLLFLFGWQSLQIPFLLLIASIPFSIEYKVSTSLGTDLPDEGLMLLLTLLAVFYLASNLRTINVTSWKHPILWLIGFSFLWAIVCSISSSQPLLSVKFILAKAWYFGAFIGAALILLQDKRNLLNTAIVLTGSMVLVVLIVLVRHAPYNFSFADINTALQPFFRNHVNYSALLVCMTPLLYAAYKFSDNKLVRRCTMLAMLVVLVALFLSYARGAWLALLTGFIAWWMIRKKLLIRTYLLTIVACTGLIFWLGNNNRYLRFAHDYRTTIFHENFSEHLVATYQMKDVSTAERFYRWIAGVRMVQEKPFMGFGPNSFYNNYRPYAIPAFKTWVSNNPEHSTVHNYFLLLAIEQGIPGLLIFLLLTILLLHYAQRIYHRNNEIFYQRTALIAGSILVMVLTVNFLSDLIETDKIGSIFFLCVSALIVADIKTRKA